MTMSCRDKQESERKTRKRVKERGRDGISNGNGNSNSTSEERDRRTSRKKQGKVRKAENDNPKLQRPVAVCVKFWSESRLGLSNKGFLASTQGILGKDSRDYWQGLRSIHSIVNSSLERKLILVKSGVSNLNLV